MKRLYVWVVVILVVIGAIVAGTWAYLSTHPCTPGREPAIQGVHYCPPPPPASPTTFIASGTVFTINAGQYAYFQFQLSSASFAVLTGSFTTTHGAAIFVMTPSEFANFSLSGSTTFRCSSTGDSCFTTGAVSAGSVNISVLPVFQSDQGGRMVVDPWFLVMQNSNASVDTNITWDTSLVATYVDVLASTSTITSDVFEKVLQ